MCLRYVGMVLRGRAIGAVPPLQQRFAKRFAESEGFQPHLRPSQGKRKLLRFMFLHHWALRVSNPRPPGCKPGALAAELSARARKTPGTAVPGLSLELHRIGAAAAAGAFAVRIGDAETAAVELVMEVDRGSGHVEQTAL